MNLPEHRRIARGRTWGQAWDACAYACAIEVGHRPWWWRLLKFIRRFL